MSSTNQVIKKQINLQKTSDKEKMSIVDEDDLDIFKSDEFDNSGLTADEYENSADDSSQLNREQKLKRLEHFKMEAESKEYSTKSLLQIYPHTFKGAHKLREEVQELRRKLQDNSSEEVYDNLPNPAPQN